MPLSSLNLIERTVFELESGNKNVDGQMDGQTNGQKTDKQTHKIENFNYLNVAFISYKLTMWDLMLFSGCHTRGQRLKKKIVLVSHRIYW